MAPTEKNTLPELFVERLEKILPPEHRERVLKSFECVRPAVFRLQAAGEGPGPGEVIARLKESGLLAEVLPWYENGFILKQGTLRQLQETELYQKGLLYIQGASSMFVPLVLDVQPGQRVLDMAAAPGSKTTQMAHMMKGEGELAANDPSRSRFFRLKASVDAQGFGHVRLIMKNGQFLWRQFPEYFDRVLLDAPCSGEARFSLSKESQGHWKLAKIKAVAAKQKLLILSAFSALKPGGILVYSTCTFAPEENEEVLDWALEKFGPAAVPEAFDPPFPYSMEGMVSWRGKDLDPLLKKTRRILPDADTEAFFIAKIRKTDSWTAERKKA